MIVQEILINLKNNLEQNSDTSNLLNLALEDVLFMFKKVKEEELQSLDQMIRKQKYIILKGCLCESHELCVQRQAARLEEAEKLGRQLQAEQAKR